MNCFQIFKMEDNNLRNLSRNVSMICSLCGNNMFSMIDSKIEELEEIPEETLLSVPVVEEWFPKEIC